MDYVIDIDPVDFVIRLRILEEIVTLPMVEEIHAKLKRLSSGGIPSGGPWAVIYDLSAVKATTISVEDVRGFPRTSPAVPLERP